MRDPEDDSSPSYSRLRTHNCLCPGPSTNLIHLCTAIILKVMVVLKECRLVEFPNLSKLRAQRDNLPQQLTYLKAVTPKTSKGVHFRHSVLCLRTDYLARQLSKHRALYPARPGLCSPCKWSWIARNGSCQTQCQKQHIVRLNGVKNT